MEMMSSAETNFWKDVTSGASAELGSSMEWG
jgi:hypothetical protein